MFFMGIDLGTTNCKIAIYDKNGLEVDSDSFSTPVLKDNNGFSEYNVKLMWEKLKKSIRKLSENNNGHKIASIAISSQGESGLLVDKKNNPLTNIIAWYDTRTKTIMKNWRNKITDEELYKITGLELNYIHSILKLKWLQENEKEIFKKADKWHCLSDYFIRKLGGEAVMDYSLASRTMAFNIVEKDWSNELFDKFNLPIELMPKAVASGTNLGQLTTELAEELNLNKKIRLAAGGFDHMCGMFGIEADNPDQIIASIGTTESICLYKDTINTSKIKKGYSLGCHVFEDKYYQLGGMPSGGEVIDWAINNVLDKELNKESYEYFEKKINESNAGSNGVIFLPHLKGCVTPKVDPDSQAAFWGLKLRNNTADICRSVVEGLSFEFKLLINELNKEQITSVLAMGGGTKNNSWMQIKSDVLSIPIKTLNVKDAVTYGAAKLGAKALKDENIIKDKGEKIKETFYPNKKNNDLYEKLYIRIYKHLYDYQKNITTKLNEII